MQEMSYNILKNLKSHEEDRVMKRKCLSLAASLLFMGLLALNGCGSSSSKEGVAEGISKVSETACTTCHSATLEKLTGAPVVANYIASIHNLKQVGCQDCHGPGGSHNGVGPIPYPDPTSPKDPAKAQCYNCHSDKASYALSKHAAGEEEFGQKCNRCHTHQGAVLASASGFTGDKAVMDALVGAPAELKADEGEHIKCNTCHETHKPNELRTVVNWDPNRNGKMDQFDLCTSCHTYYKGDDAKTIVTSGTGTYSTSAFYHNTAWYRVLASTHWDNPATGVGLSSTTIEGYVIRTTSANPCFDCHGHEFKTNTSNLIRNDQGKYVLNTSLEPTIYTDWAKSAHAGKLLLQKYAAQENYKNADGSYNRSTAMTDGVMAAGVTGETGAAWEHYDWDASSRQDCQRCHTATGAANFLSNPSGYNPAKNDFRHLSGWTGTLNPDGTFSNITSSPQNELLYCWGCHSNAAKGVLRNPGALSFTYSNGATATYPNVSGSNVCLACHTGRETGDSIKNSTDSDGILSFINSHYLAAGGQLYGTTGYEYEGKDYANPAYFKHDKIGSADAPGTGTNGPCVGCHMTTPNSHLFTNVTKNDQGVITAITSTACATCHTGNYALTPEKLTEEEEGYQAALEAAKAVMASKGIYYSATYPYWYNGPNGTGGAYTNWAQLYGLANWKNVMGAAFNINLLIRDPGGYAHNRYYVKRLLWDSIDFITNGTLGDLDMTSTIDGLSISDELKAKAKTYLGTQRP